ncbi:MAG: NlpC/P60 family protein, partial [Burkholderiaceae bacterium]
VNPDKQKQETAKSKGKAAGGGKSPATSTSTGGRGSAAAFVALCLQQAGDRYVYGAEASASDPNPNAFDCSELIEWASARVGVPFVDGSAAQIARAKPISVEQGIRTRGAILYHPGHVAVSQGNGKTIEAANSRVGVVSYSAHGRFTRAGLIPGMRY